MFFILVIARSRSLGFGIQFIVSASVRGHCSFPLFSALEQERLRQRREDNEKFTWRQEAEQEKERPNFLTTENQSALDQAILGRLLFTDIAETIVNFPRSDLFPELEEGRQEFFATVLSKALESASKAELYKRTFAHFMLGGVRYGG